MTDSEIIDIIKSLEKECERYKDGGREFISRLAQKLNNTVDEEKEAVFGFFFKEIRNQVNSHFGYLALEVFSEMKATEVAPTLEKICREEYSAGNSKKKNFIIATMMELKYDKPVDLYAEYLKYYNDDVYERYWNVFFDYCKDDWSRSIPILSLYFADVLSFSTLSLFFLKKKVAKLCMVQRINHLSYYYFQNNDSYFLELVKQVALKNKKAAKALKKLLTEYLSKKTSKDYYTAEKCDKIIGQLERFTI